MDELIDELREGRVIFIRFNPDSVYRLHPAQVVQQVVVVDGDDCH